jgi:hypothetical protein
MSRTRTLAMIAGLVSLAQVVHGQDRSRYRDFRLGSDLASVAALAKVAPSEAKILHQRPAVIQELEWRPDSVTREASEPQSDPVQRIVFSFYDDQLFKLVISYDHRRTNGLTDVDMIDAISQIYGLASLPTPTSIPAFRPVVNGELGLPIARWGDAEYSVGLYRSSFASEFRVVVASPRLETLARTAIAQAVQLDEREAPQREIDRQKQEAEDARAAQEKARETNKATFRP